MCLCEHNWLQPINHGETGLNLNLKELQRMLPFIQLQLQWWVHGPEAAGGHPVLRELRFWETQSLSLGISLVIALSLNITHTSIYLDLDI